MRLRFASALLLIIAACSAGLAPSSPSASPSAPATTEPPAATPSPSPSSASIDVPGALGEALAFADATTRSLTFGDWTAIKATLGASAITSANTFDEKRAALAKLFGGRDVAATEAIFGGFGLNFIQVHVDVWGFDAMDLDWEANYFGALPGMWVLRFRSGFDFAPLHARLDDYGYSMETLPLGVLRSSEDFFAITSTDSEGRTIQVATTSQFQIANTAFLDDGRTVVMYADPRDATAGPEALSELLTTGLRGPLDLSLESVARLLDEPFTARLDVGAACTSFRGEAGSPEVAAAIDALLIDAGPLNAYNAIGTGYSREHDPIGRVVMGYAEASSAEADLEGRRFLAIGGIESHGRPYSEIFFTLGDARVEERAVIIDLAPVDDLARQLTVAAQGRDMLFAYCQG